ncbi:HAD-like domain-containing protein [Cunninghamella echinulata]|nr:HAD-like domain-containing protein [Cunninghamella echinulata]
MVNNLDFSQIKMVASDLDGTLVSHGFEVSARAIKVLKELEDIGFQIILASGRPPRSMALILDMIKLSHPLVLCCNGAVVLDHEKKKIIKSFTIAQEYLFNLLKKMKDTLGNDIYIGVESGLLFKCEQGYALKRGPENMNHDYIIIDELEEFVMEPVEKIVVVHKEWPANQLDHYLKTVIFNDAVWDRVIHITYSNPHFIEISAVGISKGTTIKSITEEQLGLNSKNLIAFGDMPNDLQMLEYAGIGVAMENALDEVKKIADHVTLTNEEDGVAVVLEKLLEYKKNE